MTDNKATAKNPVPRNDNKYVFLLALCAVLFDIKYERVQEIEKVEAKKIIR
jgi:hypothetical protein